MSSSSSSSSPTRYKSLTMFQIKRRYSMLSPVKLRLLLAATFSLLAFISLISTFNTTPYDLPSPLKERTRPRPPQVEGFETSEATNDLESTASIVVSPSSNSSDDRKDEKDQNLQTQFDPVAEYEKFMKRSPVVVYSKSYCKFSLRLKTLLHEKYSFTPHYIVVELDKLENGAALQSYIAQQTGRRTVPNLIVNGVSLGGSDEIVALHEEGKLLDRLQESSDSKFEVRLLTT
ncbi:HHR079Cp [Eremothecium sinecaudum]|uniref:HHR079Cp n=1 Tax=Eremothecium sinecaudum TaxID=45286 RepID=A0A120K2W7_9SACH|nr:HHR079Cp [Eremothecium sinecaudum]AMD22848.1 HHR079Cp [Eremothecium sinecaudum]